ncbi:unnamed protein product [Absidia cylindrospora]
MAAIEQQKTSFAIPKLAQDLIAGTIGGWAQVVVGHPFDTLKVRMQTQPSPPIYKNAMDCSINLSSLKGPKVFIVVWLLLWLVLGYVMLWYSCPMVILDALFKWC